MAGSSISNNTTYRVRVRSISLPTTSHPSIHSIKKELNGVETWVSMSSSCKPSIEAIYDGLLKLSRLYECMHEVMSVLCSNQDEKHVKELMDTLIGFLDVCDIMRDIMSRYKEHVRDLQCALRRRKGDTCVKNSTVRFNNFRKEVKKDVKRLLTSLKQTMVVKSQDHSHQHQDDHDHVVVARMVLEVTVSVFESLLIHFVMPNSQTTNTCKWSMVVSKLIQRTRVACEDQRYQQTKDIARLNLVLGGQCIQGEQLSCWWNDVCMLEALEAQIERIDDGLECIFRSMIRTRASFLNIVSNY
ncbi:hypothetical protein QVD17_09487 [Tagetes erecta]|uniref:Uncharacterized protein n=1 Tax=Tagetes erecta TaxID=13708 RepID=A0AAD8KZE8_TARER|nr:hypothetical protein QVD17_09487 [Tagetes erecta]